MKKKYKNPIPPLRKKADKLFQQVGLLKYRYSLVSGKPAEVIHHFIIKGACAATRYDFDNAIPLTCGEHCKIHMAQDSMMVVTITDRMKPGQLDRLKKKKQEQIKTGVGYYRDIIEKLEEELKNYENA